MRSAGAKAKNDLVRHNSIPWFLRDTRAAAAPLPLLEAEEDVTLSD
jgi:hypothetical protein